MFVVLSTGTVIKTYHIEQYLGMNDRQVMMRVYIIDRNAIEKKPSSNEEFSIKWVKGQMYIELSAMTSSGDYVHHIDGRSRPDINMPEGVDAPLAYRKCIPASSFEREDEYFSTKLAKDKAEGIYDKNSQEHEALIEKERKAFEESQQYEDPREDKDNAS